MAYTSLNIGKDTQEALKFTLAMLCSFFSLAKNLTDLGTALLLSKTLMNLNHYLASFYPVDRSV
ncbi:hypothetical protein BpHYR1_033196 [Brachionus plicatilis]|uniref:Uncharacterized protein n=1 Tax=Brachionus plicatilis TaxID=10195 RepID=A0A3M7QN80_BRAPC|nr:hypothetical protein BpHYR1_033196 [Brachionus plicatilis]